MYYSKEPIALEYAERIAPSILAEQHHESRSDQYSYVPTRDVLQKLMDEGFNIHGVTEAGTRDKTRLGFQKHLIRMRREESLDKDQVPELIVINSHDGSSSFRLMTGLFRFACANGIICGQSWQDVRVKHTGDIVDNVIEGTFEVVDQFDKVANRVNEIKAIELTQDEQTIFAKSCIPLRFDLDENGNAPITTDQANRVVRRQDNSASLWSTFNRVQENLVRGGLITRRKDQYGRIRRARSRAVNGIDANVKLNRALFSLAEEMATLKA